MTIFTAKWCYVNDGVYTERLIEADQVYTSFHDLGSLPRDGAPYDKKLGVYTVPRDGLVVIGNPSDGAESMALAFGKVYIMNRDGATVATYQLARDEPAQGSDTRVASFA